MENLWLLISATLVFVMQAGFLCLESGKVRSKNTINVAAKNISDFVVSTIVFWMFGFALMFGDSISGIVGTSNFFFGTNQTPFAYSFFLFQLMFCGTAATLVSGAVAERMSYAGYLIVTALLSALIYPISGHWAWASIFNPNNLGWLESFGFIDFAGSTVVHSVGGAVALAAIIVVGPRIGRFDSPVQFSSGHNIPLTVLGALLIWLGWIGFNGGSTLQFSNQVPSIVLNTFIAAAWGGFGSSLCQYYFHRYIDVSISINGILAGLVAITAGCHGLTPPSAMIVGTVAGLVMYGGNRLMDKLKLDDAVGVVPTHLMAGIWGTLAVALFGDTQLFMDGHTRLEQLAVQAGGVLVICSYSFFISLLLLKLLNRFAPLRVSVDAELHGMNVTEHRASTELLDLLQVMQHQQQQGKFSDCVPVEPFTEIGQIAKQYNQVINRVNSEIKKRDAAIQDFRNSELRKSAILNASMDSIVTINPDGIIVEFNPAAEKSFGIFKHQVLGRVFMEYFIPRDNQPEFANSLSNEFLLSEGIILNQRSSTVLKRISGDTFPAEITITSSSKSHHYSTEFTLHIRDITSQQKMQSRLKQLAYCDPLTGLFNRTYFTNCLNIEIVKANKEGKILAVFFLDLDRFKKINDTLGHKTGDGLLCEVSSRIRSITRESDIVARWGGDEFVILFTGDITHNFVHSKANRILNLMRVPISVDNMDIRIPTSIGIAFSSPSIHSASQLVQHADLSMYAAKQNGRDTFRIFKPDMAAKAKRQFRFEQEMRLALEAQDQITLAYQPKVNHAKDIVGLEALIRWNHPQHGMISPSEFIPLAEDSNMILKLGDKIIEMAFNDMHTWQKKGFELVPVSINLSANQLVSGQLLSSIKNKLAKYQLNGSFVEFEITEGVLLSDVDRCIRAMIELRTLNIKFSIDDFGTGYSSLNYLKRLPIDVLKIDRTFVDKCAELIEDAQICETIINLAHNLGLTIVAEGVETQGQFEFLNGHDCNYFQGFYFYRPLPANEVSSLLSVREEKCLV